MVQREMEKSGLGDKVDCTLDQMTSICRLRANPEREKQGGIVPPPLRSWPLGRRSGRVATAPYPPPKPSSIVVPRLDSGNDPAGIKPPAGSPRAPLSFVLAPHRACGPARRRSPSHDRPACPRV